MSFRLRLTFIGAALVALTLLAFGWLVYQLVANSQANTQDDALKQRAADAFASIGTAPPGELDGTTAPSLSGAEDLRQRTDVFTEILTSSGMVLSSTGRLGSAAPPVPATLLEAAVNAGALATVDAPGSPQLRLYARLWARTDLGLHGFVVAGQPTSVQSANRKGLLGFLIVSSLPTLIAAFIATWLVTGRALRPLKTVVDTANSIARTRDLKRRLPPAKRRDEIGLLSEGFNGMLNQLEAANQQLTVALEAQRRFVADASHELRTPLTVIRGQLEVLAAQPNPTEDDVKRVERLVQAEIGRISRLVDDLLVLTQAERTDFLRPETIELPSFVAEIWDGLSLTAERRFELGPIPGGTLTADPDRLAQALRNLGRNAIEHTAEGVGLVRGRSGGERQDPLLGPG